MHILFKGNKLNKYKEEHNGNIVVLLQFSLRVPTVATPTP
jgi:hypothetical protein